MTVHVFMGVPVNPSNNLPVGGGFLTAGALELGQPPGLSIS
jgi:hypothetical protein